MLDKRPAVWYISGTLQNSAHRPRCAGRGGLIVEHPMTQFAPSLLATSAAERTRFVAALARAGTIHGACRATGAAERTVGNQRRRDPAFDAACAAITGGTAATRLENALISRATLGVERRKEHANGTVETWTEFDNKLGFALLAKMIPARYGAGTSSATIAAPPVPAVSDAEAALLRTELTAALDARAWATGAELEPSD